MTAAMTSATECPLCGRAGGHLGADREYCARCQQELAPTDLQAWREAAGVTVDEIAEACGCVPMTVKRALRGDPVSPLVAAALAELTGIDAAQFMSAEP
jgi:hypothetical protein